MKYLFLFFLALPVLADVELFTTTNDIHYEGASEQAGSLTMTINADDFADASLETPIFIRVTLSNHSVLARDLVNSQASFWRFRDPLFLALSLESDVVPGTTLQAPADTVCIVRWVAGEQAFWIRVQRSSTTWVGSPSGSSLAKANPGVSWTLGISARDSFNRQSQFDETAVNLPFNSRNLSAMAEDLDDAVSSLLTLNLSQPTFLPGQELSLAFQAFDYRVWLGDDFFDETEGNALDIAFVNETRVAVLRDEIDDVNVIFEQDQTETRRPVDQTLDTFTKRMTLRLNTEQSDLMLYNGSSLLLSAGSMAGFKKGGARIITLNGDCVESETGYVVSTNPFELGGKTCYGDLEIKWNDGMVPLNGFEVTVEATLFHQRNVSPYISDPVFIGWRLQVIRQPSGHDESPFDGTDQIAGPDPQPLSLASAQWLVANLTFPRLVPHVTLSDGLFTTFIEVTNVDSKENVLEFFPYNADGSDIGYAYISLDPGETWKIQPHEWFLAEVSHIDMDGNPKLKVSTSYKAAREGAGPAHVPAIHQASQSWVVQAGDHSLTYDSIAFVNRGDDPTDIYIQQRDASGAVVSEPFHWGTLGANAKGTAVLNNLFEPAVGGSYLIYADQNLTLVSLRGDHDSTHVWQNDAQPIMR